MATITLHPIEDSQHTHNENNLSLATIRAAAGTTGARNNQSQALCSLEAIASTTTGNFSIMHRGLFSFYTGDIPAGATITSATFTLTRSGGNNHLGDYEICLVGASPADPTYHSIDPPNDFQNVHDTPLAQRVLFSEWADATKKTFNLNAAGLAWINKGGYTSFAFRTGWDLDNSFTGTWGADKWSEIFAYSKEHPTQDDHPVLVISYTEGPVHELAGTIEATSSTTSANLIVEQAPIPETSFAVIERSKNGGTFAVVGTVNWLLGEYTDETGLEIGATYTYRTSKQVEFDVNGPPSDTDSIVYDNPGDKELEGTVVASAGCQASLYIIATSSFAIIDRKVGDGAYSQLAIIPWGDTSYTDDGPFTINEVYTYRTRKIQSFGLVGPASPDGPIIYDPPGEKPLAGAISVTATVSGLAVTYLTNTVAKIERRIDDGPFVPFDYLDWTVNQTMDPGPFVPGKLYAYRVTKVVSDIETAESDIVGVVYSVPEPVVLGGTIATKSVATGDLLVSAVAIIEMEFDEWPFWVIAYAPYSDGQFIHENEFVEGAEYRYRIAKRISGSDPVYSNVVAVTWRKPQYVTIAGSFSAASNITGHATKHVSVSGNIDATVVLAGSAFNPSDISGSIRATSSSFGAIGFEFYIFGTTAATSSASGMCSLSMTTSGTAKGVAMFYAYSRLLRGITGKVDALTDAKGELKASISTHGTLAPTVGAQARLSVETPVSGTSATTSFVDLAFLNIHGERFVVSNTLRIRGTIRVTYKLVARPMSFAQPIGGLTHTVRRATQWVASHVDSVTGESTGYVYDRYFLEIIIGEGPTDILVD